MKKVILVLKSCENCPYLIRKEATTDARGRSLVAYNCKLTGRTVSSFVASWRNLEFTIESGENLHYLKNSIHPECPLDDYENKGPQAVSSDEYILHSQQPTQAAIDLSKLRETRKIEDQEDGWEPTK